MWELGPKAFAHRADSGCPLRKITPATQERRGLMGESWARVQSVWQEIEGYGSDPGKEEECLRLKWLPWGFEIFF